MSGIKMITVQVSLFMFQIITVLILDIILVIVLCSKVHG